MEESHKNILKIGVAGAVLAAAIVLGAMRWRSSFSSDESQARAFFYDQSERRLYAAPRDSLPPHEGVGGEAGDGVRAVVVAPAGDPSSRTIAYLETYSPALHDKLAFVQAAKKAGKGAGVKGPAGDEPFVLRNTMVRRESEAQWHDMTTAEARRIMMEWTTRRDAQGRPLTVVTP